MQVDGRLQEHRQYIMEFVLVELLHRRRKLFHLRDHLAEGDGRVKVVCGQAVAAVHGKFQCACFQPDLVAVGQRFERVTQVVFPMVEVVVKELGGAGIMRPDVQPVYQIQPQFAKSVAAFGVIEITGEHEAIGGVGAGAFGVVAVLGVEPDQAQHHQSKKQRLGEVGGAAALGQYLNGGSQVGVGDDGLVQQVGGAFAT